MAVRWKGEQVKLEGADKQPDVANLRSTLISLCKKGDASALESQLQQITKDDRQTLLNTKDEKGTTPLHESCCQGNVECATVLLKSGADAIIWDVRGFSPIHCAAYNGHSDSIQLLLKWEPHSRASMSKCVVDTTSRFDETALHIACYRGHFEVARSLVDENEANVVAKDKDENTVLHYATSSNNGKLLTWLLSIKEVKEMINDTNKHGQTVAHRAAILGCVISVSVLIQSGADFTLKDQGGRSALDLARLLNNQQCYEIAAKKKSPLPVTDTPPPARASFFMSNESLQPQRSISNGSAYSAAVSCGSPQQLRRHGSITKRTRPISQYVTRRASFQTRDSEPAMFNPGHRRSSSSRGGSLLNLGGSMSGYLPMSGRDSIASIASLHGSTDNFSYTSRETLAVLKEKENKSKSCKEMEENLLFESSYDPPPDLHFIPPTMCEKLTQPKNELYSKSHEVFLRIPTEHWERTKDKEVEVRICATMGLSQYPDNYIIVSPICFISCKAPGGHGVVLRLKLPHAAQIDKPEYRNKVCILSSMTPTNLQKNPNTPLFTPTGRQLHPLTVSDLEFDVAAVIFKLNLKHSALFAVAVPCTPVGVPRSIPIPLRCKLYVLYKIYDKMENLGRVFIHTYIAMELKAVETDIQALKELEGLELEHAKFKLNCPSVFVSANVRNSEAWDVTPMLPGNGLFEYHQVALSSQALEKSMDSFSHDHPYPVRQRFFVEPKNARGAIKCDVTVTSTTNEPLTSLLVLPYLPTSKDTTPEPSSRASTCPPSPSGSRIIIRPGIPQVTFTRPGGVVNDEQGTMV